jgi:putative Ca2+/H+ antiporter (TMEM165/GDT1 family)
LETEDKKGKNVSLKSCFIGIVRPSNIMHLSAPLLQGGLAGHLLGMVFSQIFIKAFTLTFLAEWGDRSQIATIGYGDAAGA